MSEAGSNLPYSKLPAFAGLAALAFVAVSPVQAIDGSARVHDGIEVVAYGQAARTYWYSNGDFVSLTTAD